MIRVLEAVVNARTCYNADMSRHISESSFYRYLKCPEWVYFDAHNPEDRPHEVLLDLLLKDGLVDEFARRAISDRKEVMEVTAEDPEEAFRQTVAFMQEGRQTIYRGVLVSGHCVGHPDVLERVEGKSHFGSYYYVAADIKRAREVRDEYKFQGCFYAELLGKLQGTKPVNGYVITTDGAVLEYAIEDFEHEYRIVLDDIERIVAGEKPVHFTSSSCKQSPWFEKCHGQSKECDDLSLLNRVWREEVVRLKDAGILTITMLAGKSVKELESLAPDLSPVRLELLRDQAIAIRDNTFMIRRKADMPESDVELFFDIESDPLRDFDYLFGVVVVDEKGTETYHGFFAETPEEEGKMWKEFLTLIEQYIDAPVYHYGWFEVEVIQRFAAKYGISELVREALDRNLIDLLFIMRPAVIFPLTFYSLKDIATFVGFSWRSADANGANSVLWFEEWLRTRDPALKKKILEYNEDDCVATYRVQRWLREQMM